MDFYYIGIDKWGERRYYCKRERNNRFVTSSKAFPKIFLIFSVCGEEVFLYLLEWKLCFLGYNGIFMELEDERCLACLRKRNLRLWPRLTAS